MNFWSHSKILRQLGDILMVLEKIYRYIWESLYEILNTGGEVLKFIKLDCWLYLVILYFMNTFKEFIVILVKRGIIWI